VLVCIGMCVFVYCWYVSLRCGESVIMYECMGGLFCDCEYVLVCVGLCWYLLLCIGICVLLRCWYVLLMCINIYVDIYVGVCCFVCVSVCRCVLLVYVVVVWYMCIMCWYVVMCC